MNWNVDINELIPFLGKTIYRPENVLVEMCANSYDADASEVKINTKGDTSQILIRDNGSGMNEDDLKELITIAKSKKKKMIEDGKTTPQYERKVLGSFGIGIISFFALGDFIKIFSRRKDEVPVYIEIKKVFDEDGKLIEISVSDPIKNEEYAKHLISNEKGTTIEINNDTLNTSENRTHHILRHKLSNLPLSKDFKIYFNDNEIKKDDFDSVNWISKTFDFTLDNIDANYKSKCEFYVNVTNPIDDFKRGLYLVVNGRVIEKNLYSELYQELSSPNTLAYRFRGFIYAGYLDKSIQANREDFFDTQIIREIKDKVRDEINKMTADYKQQRSDDDKEETHAALLQRIERAKNKTNAPNNDLKKLGLNFQSNPQYEQEVVLILSQLCQLGHLPFKILDYSGNSHIDCIVAWPPQQTERYPDYIGELEVETSLDHFFKHQHDFRTKPDICCWELKEADFEREKNKYIRNHPESIKKIELKDAENSDHFGHQKEIHFTINESHNELKTFLLRVYVLTSIIKTIADKS